MQDILDGTYDSYIMTVAQQVKELGSPVMLGLFGEVDAAALFGYGADGNAYVETVDDRTGQFGDPTLADGPERVAAVYRHVVDLFRAQGADNVSWFIYTGTTTMNAPDAIHPSAYFPGNAYVDWVGQSLYVADADAVRGTFDAGYAAWTGITDKPFFIPELGLEGDAGGDRAGAMSSMLATLATYDRLGAATWADFEGAASIYGVPRLGSTPGEWASLTTADGYVFGSADLVGGNGGGTPDPDPVPSPDPTPAYLEGTSGADRLVGGDGDDVIEGKSGDDELLGGLGLDVLYGGDGMDVLSGGAGDDMLTGGAGVDVLDGGAGRDTLIFGEGDDTVTGGEGADMFLFAAQCAMAAVTDFDPLADLLVLEAHDAASLDALLARSYDSGSGVLLTVDAASSTYLWMAGVSMDQLDADNVLL